MQFYFSLFSFLERQSGGGPGNGVDQVKVFLGKDAPVLVDRYGRVLRVPQQEEKRQVERRATGAGLVEKV